MHEHQAVGYMERTRLYYRALGYSNDYQWAKNDSVPFQPLSKSLTDCSAALVTTASPPGGPPNGNPRLKQVWSANIADAPLDLSTQFLAWDKEATHTQDRESYLPLAAMRKLVAAGRLGNLTQRFHGVPTTYSQRQTRERDGPEIVKRVKDDGADIALLFPM